MIAYNTILSASQDQTFLRGNNCETILGSRLFNFVLRLNPSVPIPSQNGIITEDGFFILTEDGQNIIPE